MKNKLLIRGAGFLVASIVLFSAGGIIAKSGTAAGYAKLAPGDDSWDAQLGVPGCNGNVRALAVIGTKLYAGGDFTSAGGVAANHVAVWDGVSWAPLGSGTDSTVNALAVSGTTLYAGGTFTTAGGVTVNSIAQWDGTSWSALGSGLGALAPLVNALTVRGTTLFAAGYFSTAGGVPVNSIAAWDGSAWSAVGSLSNFGIYALASDGTSVFAGGFISSVGDADSRGVARWDGTQWNALGSGLNDLVLSLMASGGRLYAGGWFTTAGGVPASRIAVWDGSAWSALGSGLSQYDPFAMAVIGSRLYVGGSFAAAGGIPVNNIAAWDGTHWLSLGSGTNAGILSLAAMGGSLYAGGAFTTAGEKASNRISRWIGDPSNLLLHLSRTAMTFGGVAGGAVTSPQSVVVSGTGVGTLHWTAAPSASWITASPGSGAGGATIAIGADITGLAAGTYSGFVTFSDPAAANSPQRVTVDLNVFAAGGSAPPFGVFETPSHAATGITGAIPVTGWVLDDIGTAKVEIKRDQVTGDPSGAIGPDGLVYIGDATFVEGARPDVERDYPTYPRSSAAGWGYMLLTNFLPGQGNGSYTLHAIATDKEGNVLTLGPKTITCDNAHAVKPFGTIDTPAQGGDASGNPFVSFGWVLTPQPKTVPKEGSTISVWIDSVEIGDLSTLPNLYDQYRADVSTNFPGLKNTGAPGAGGPVGAYYLDTTAYSNGVHTIWWVAYDDDGQADGIGSRYFNIVNTNTAPEKSSIGSAGNLASGAAQLRVQQIRSLPRSFTPLRVSMGFDLRAKPRELFPDQSGIHVVEIPEVNRLVIELDPEPGSRVLGPLRTRYSGFLVFGDELRPLPIGSTLDALTGRFSWMPGPGFLGSYDLVFIGGRGRTVTQVRITIVPKY